MASKLLEPGDPKGVYVILNKLTTREEGSPEDVEQINSVFAKLRFLNLYPPAINDFGQNEVRNAISHLTSYPNNDIPRFMFLMTHGHEEGQLEDNSGRLFHINDVINHFNIVENAHLKDTFKMILVNACRGEEEPIFFDSPSKTIDPDLHENLVVGFSCLERKKSPRLRGGSPFIKVACEVLDEDYDSVPMPFLLDEISKRLSNYRMNRKEWNLTPEFKYFGHFSKQYQELPVELVMSIEKNAVHSSHESNSHRSYDAQQCTKSIEQYISDLFMSDQLTPPESPTSTGRRRRRKPSKSSITRCLKSTEIPVHEVAEQRLMELLSNTSSCILDVPLVYPPEIGFQNYCPYSHIVDTPMSSPEMGNSMIRNTGVSSQDKVGDDEPYSSSNYHSTNTNTNSYELIGYDIDRLLLPTEDERVRQEFSDDSYQDFCPVEANPFAK